MVKPYHVILRIDRLPRMNVSAWVHWRTRVRDRQQWAWLMLQACGPQRRRKPLERAFAVFTRYSSRQGDYDNLVASFKLCQDLLTPHSKRNPGGMGLIVADDPQHLEAEYCWEQVPRGQGYITIEVDEIA